MILLLSGPPSYSASSTTIFQRLSPLGVNATGCSGKKKRECLGVPVINFCLFRFLYCAYINPLYLAFLSNVKGRERHMKQVLFSHKWYRPSPICSDYSFSAKHQLSFVFIRISQFCDKNFWDLLSFLLVSVTFLEFDSWSELVGFFVSSSFLKSAFKYVYMFNVFT